MAYQSEAELEKQLMQNLMMMAYIPVVIPDEAALWANFRVQLSAHNRENIAENPLSDKEFERIRAHVEGKSVFQSAKILRDKYVLTRDDGSQIYLEFMNTRQWCQNLYQVTRQTTVVGKYTNRYDITLLINGLPLIQIELKRRGEDLKQAINQLERYRKHSYHGLYRYIQIFIISNGVDTKYLANNDRHISYEFTFYWSDEKNNRITNVNEFVMTFLERCHVSKMIARYMVINDTDKMLMVMRPYQVYAVEALVHRALETNNNGFIWHTTGSGKTLTSFKASQIIAAEPTIKKVFFLVDRKDLDAQTVTEFNKFEDDSVDATDRTSVLVKQIKEKDRHLIVTTIQKLANAIKSSKYAKTLDTYRDEKVVFIIDECHRSQFGDMHKAINEHFNHAQYFGFTGTPRFEENKSQDGRVTADLFEKCLHTYLIKDAIRDNNVLGFSVEYIKTFDGQYSENDKTKVHSIDTEEIFMSDERIQMVAEHIIDHHSAKSRNGQYCAIFTVQSIPMLIKYYDIFQKMQHDYKIAGIFTFDANEDSDEGSDEHSRDSLDRIISDYNKIFDTNFSTDNFSSYFIDVSKREKTAQLDILLVVNMFLTGFDSKPLNTLYVDKPLKYHDLLQAFSRTNRVEKPTKPYGNIVCYRNLKEHTDDALRRFSSENGLDMPSTVLFGPYVDYLREFKNQLRTLYMIALTPSDVDSLESEEEKARFVLAFRELSKTLLRLQTFTEFQFTTEMLGISEQQYQDFKSKYFTIYNESIKFGDEKVSVLADIDFSIELMRTDKINVSYILNLIRNIDFDNDMKKEKDIKHILHELDKADSEDMHLKIDLLRNFLHKVVPILSSASSIDDAYSSYEDEVRKNEIDTFSKVVGVDSEFISSEIAAYEYSGAVRYQEISDHIHKPLLIKKKLSQRIADFIIEHVKKYQ